VATAESAFVNNAPPGTTYGERADPATLNTAPSQQTQVNATYAIVTTRMSRSARRESKSAHLDDHG
jgi:hypothetical protein